MKTLVFFLILMLALPLAALPKAALLGMSALLPGSGEIALGKNTRGAILIGADVLAFTSWWATNREKNDLIDSYKRYATVYAGIPEGMDEQYYQHIQEYISSDEFNQYQELNARNYYLIYTYDPEGYSEYMAINTYDPSEAWEWQSTQHQDHYDKLRRETQTTKMYENLSLGAVILNRVISVIDVALISRDRSQGHTLYFSPLQTSGLMLNYQMEF